MSHENCPMKGVMGTQYEVKHYDIDITCLNCGYDFPHMSIDEAAYYVRKTMGKIKCPACFATPDYLSVVIRVSPDKFTHWNGRFDVLDATSEGDFVASVIRLLSDIKGSA